MIKLKQKILFLFLIVFSIYCALSIGQSWDEEFLINQACLRVSNQAQLLDAIEFFARDKEAAGKYAHRAKEVVEKNKGSTEVQASYIIRKLGEKH